MNAGDLKPICDGKYASEEAGTVFEDAPAGGGAGAAAPLPPPADGTRVEVFQEVSSEYESGRKRTYRSGDYVYFVPKAGGPGPLSVGKVACFLTYEPEGGGGVGELTKVVLLQRYPRADHPGIRK